FSPRSAGSAAVGLGGGVNMGAVSAEGARSNCSGRVGKNAAGWPDGWYQSALAETKENVTKNAIAPPTATGLRATIAPPACNSPPPFRATVRRLGEPATRFMFRLHL